MFKRKSCGREYLFFNLLTLHSCNHEPRDISVLLKSYIYLREMSRGVGNVPFFSFVESSSCTITCSPDVPVPI